MLRRKNDRRAIAAGGGGPVATAPFSRRTALAPVELVLNLFFMLVIMALIINAGTIASWHVRGNTAARYAAWRSLAPRTGDKNPNPANWKAPATLQLAPAKPLPSQSVGNIWNRDDLSQPALRGPNIVDPVSGSQIHLSGQNYLEMIDQALVGSADLTKAMPLLPRLRKSQIRPSQSVLDHAWRYEDMSRQTNQMAMRNNDDWRLYAWYLFEAQQLGDANLNDAFSRLQVADQRLRRFQYQLSKWESHCLGCLDCEFRFFDLVGLVGDFYPTVAGCEISILNIQLNVVYGPQGLISRIEGPSGGGRGGVPELMAREFIRWKKFALIPFYQAMQDQPVVDQLEQDIQELQKFLEILD